MELARVEERMGSAGEVRSGPAEVCRMAGPRAVQLIARGGERFVAALAVPGYDAPREGDRVLFHTDDAGRRYVIGVLSVRPPSAIDEALAAEEDRERREVRDEYGQLLFEYDPASRRAVVHVPDGDLEIAVARGGLTVSARDGVRLESERAVELSVSRSDGACAKVALGAQGATLAGAVVRLVGERAEVLAARVGIRASLMETRVDRLRQLAEVVDTRAERIIERAKDAYREVEGLSQHRAGTLRWVAEKTASILAENTLMKARDRVKIKGERIHLA
jgi:hypothetical protein